MEPDRVSLKVTSEIKNIRKVSARIIESLAQYEMDDETLFDIRLCIEEAVRNAIVHGNRLNKKQHVIIDYWVDDDSLNVAVEDEGFGFDPAKVPDPKKSENMLRESGRGVFLIKRLMDKVEFNEKGNKIRMEKRLWQ